MRCTWVPVLALASALGWGCGGGTALGGLPRPNAGVIAGIAAAAATAATIADPGAAGRSPEEGKVHNLDGVKRDGAAMPLDVLERAQTSQDEAIDDAAAEAAEESSAAGSVAPAPTP